MMKKIFSSLLTCLALVSFGQNEASWLRQNAISPDGKTIVFCYQGDLWSVPSTGGQATILTTHEAMDMAPVWSHDGKWLAFASDRYGNFDVFLMPATGGNATRLTFHSSGDIPSDFSPDDKTIIFTSGRLDNPANQQNPYGFLPELYSVPVKGGAAHQIITTPAINAKYSPDGNMLVFMDTKGYEDNFRKHHTSAVTRDIWTYDLKAKKHNKITNFNGEDRNPVFAGNSKEIYYLNESSGSFNVYKMPVIGGKSEQLTFMDKHPIRYLSSSADGLLCFSYNGELYTLRENAKPTKLHIFTNTDGRYNPEKTVSVKGEASELALSPDGKEVAFIFRGEVFVSSVKEGVSRRITNTPEQERSVSFSPDGTAILYAGERNGSWNLYRTVRTRAEEKHFFNATVLKEEALLDTPAEEFQPAYSPDGKEIAYLEERTTIKVLNLESKKTRVVMPGTKNYSYSDGDQGFDWSPDSKWLLVEFLQDNQWITQSGLVSVEGDNSIVNLTKSGYTYSFPRWTMDGKAMICFSDRDGLKNDASWGGQGDAYAIFFNKEAFDRFKLSKEEFELKKEEEDKAKEGADKDKKDKEKDKDKKEEEKDKKVDPLKIELDDIEQRKVRLTIHSSDLADAILSKDGEKMYYLAKFEKGFDLWETELRTKETKTLVKLGAENVGRLLLSADGKNLFFLSDGSIVKIELEGGKREGVGINGEMTLNEAVERNYLFEHSWRQVVKKFYRTDLHGVNWDFYKKEYAKFLPYINNNYDFAELLSELLGELNASHTGARFRPKMENPDQTAALGLFYDESYNGDGLRIAEVMRKSPCQQAGSKIAKGVVIEKIDNNAISKDQDFSVLLNRKIDKPTLLSLYNPATKERWEETVKPIAFGEENDLRYHRWVDRCAFLVDSLSHGKIGYVHVRGMDDPSYRTVYEEALGKYHGKDALVVDTRFNGGGWLHDDLATFLDGKKYLTVNPRGQNLGTEPQFKWSKPSAVVMSEGNYSDAHLFPFTYRALGIGKLIGMPVPGTGTAVWWETLQNGMVFGIPQVGMVDNNGNVLENQQLEPDILAPNDPDELAKGRDQQLEAAVKELLKSIKP